jgi:hypothetical protein
MANYEESIQEGMEFELYFSEMAVLAANSIGISASEFLDMVEAHPETTMPFSAGEFRASLKEAFIRGFRKGMEYNQER